MSRFKIGWSSEARLHSGIRERNSELLEESSKKKVVEVELQCSEEGLNSESNKTEVNEEKE